MTDASISPFLAGRLAHELRSPASVLLGTLAQLERDEGLSDTSVRLLQLARRSCARMERLSRRLDNVAASEPQTRGPAPLAAARTWIDRAAAEAARSAIEVSVGPVPEASVQGPPAHALEVAVDELVHNAVRHAQSSVKVVLEATPTHVRLHVQDDGPGLPEHLQGEGSEAPATRHGGLGLGLDLVRRFTAAVGGTVEFTANAVVVEVPR